MPSIRLANRYAKSLIDLAIEKNQLELIHTDILYLLAVCKASKEFVNVLKTPIITAEKKSKIINAVTQQHIGEMTHLFLQLLIKKHREENLPEVLTAFITQYNALKQIHTVKLTTAEPLTEVLLASIIHKIKTETALQNIEMETIVNPTIIGGFILDFNNNRVDASIARDLKDIKKQFLENEYIPELR
jgi:F-type H+-transporting ATPase subunit delta